MSGFDGGGFFSKFYRQLLTANHGIKNIYLISNGLLFDEQNWSLIKNCYSQICVTISVDAATATIYRKVRGGDFQRLLTNLEMLRGLRDSGQIQNYRLAFVVQKTNYQEMKDFVQIGKTLHVDQIAFLKLNNWGTYTKREYRVQSLLLKNGCLVRDFYEMLQDPIFKDPIVDLNAFAIYLVNSAKRYDKKRK